MFHSGIKHWQNNIKRRIQLFNANKLQQGSHSPRVDLVKDNMEEELEKLRNDHISLNIELQKLKDKQENMRKEEAVARNDKNREFWKNLFEDDSETQNEGADAEQALNFKVYGLIEEMVESKIAMEGETSTMDIVWREKNADEVQLMRS
ncbi:hypothetical protein HAX54_012443 [Datura stramonium]|uniref:Uncharacterized protein n=1 Tax=Datura stramonium TaxID=4076 RepID=A0ABS8TLN2_DATST|nr:hypothetical protein [Datura stramonium]